MTHISSTDCRGFCTEHSAHPRPSQAFDPAALRWGADSDRRDGLIWGAGVAHWLERWSHDWKVMGLSPWLECQSHDWKVMGLSPWLERWSHEWKVMGLSPGRSGSRISFFRVKFLCWLLFWYPSHPRVTVTAHFYYDHDILPQKCRWWVKAKHACTLNTGFLPEVMRHGALLRSVHIMCARTAAVLRGTSHVTTKQCCKYFSRYSEWAVKKHNSHSLRIHVWLEHSESAQKWRLVLYESQHHHRHLTTVRVQKLWKSRQLSWAPVPNMPTVSVDIKQHFNNIWPLCDTVLTA